MQTDLRAQMMTGDFNQASIRNVLSSLDLASVQSSFALAALEQSVELHKELGGDESIVDKEFSQPLND